jgi:outer membrane protein
MTRVHLFGTLLIGMATAAAAQPVAPQSIKVTAAQLLRIADAAVAKGDEANARGAYRALMGDASGDIRVEARFRLAMLESKRGNLAQAATLLRQVVDARPSAARPRLELAGLLDRMGDKDGAWRQVRAIHAAGLPPGVARLVDRYSEALRAQRPSGASLEIALAPDSNINRATRSDTLGTVLGDFEIADDGKAKSGTGLSLHAQAYRRLPLGGDAGLLVRLSGLADLYKAKRFNDIAADLAIGPELNLGRNRVQLELGATQRWFGQKPFMRSARVAATVSHPLGSRAMLRLSGSAALIDNQMNDLQDGRSFSGQASIERALSATTGIAVSGALDRQSLRDPGYSTTGWRAGLTAWRDIGRMTVTAGVELGRLHADERLLLFPDKRMDRYSRLSIGATFRQLQLRGFAPVARFSIERNKSSVAFYDFRRTRSELGIVRAF